MLIAMNPEVKKEVIINELEESSATYLDSAAWAEAFESLRDYDISAPKYPNAFSSSKMGNREVFTRAEKQKNGLQNLTIINDGSKKTITGEIHEKTSIYDNYQQLKITIEDDLIAKIELSGSQKMILLDTTKYESLLEVVR